MQFGLRLSFCAKALRRTQPAQPVQLKIGLTNDQQAEVLEGLQEGDELIVAPAAEIKTGARVKPASGI